MVLQVSGKKLDPVKNFHFQLSIVGDSEPSKGISEISSLKHTFSSIPIPDGGSKVKTETKGPLKLSTCVIKGVYVPPEATKFQQWVNDSLNSDSQSTYTKDLLITVFGDGEGKTAKAVMQVTLLGAWLQEYEITAWQGGEKGELLYNNITVNYSGIKVEHL